MRAETLLALLREKHAGDVFVEECKDGPTQVGSHLRLDAWVMPRSWAKPDTTGYEIKVSRGDFVRDEKWRSYMKLCHRLYFVCPRGVIQPEELPQDVGLLWSSESGKRLMTKRRAVARDVKLPESLFRYVLMCRSKIQRDARDDVDSLVYWRDWLARKQKSLEVGHRVSRRVYEIVCAVRAENDLLRQKMEGYDLAEKRLKEAGFDVSRPISEWELRHQIVRLRGAVPEELSEQVQRTIVSMGNLQERLRKIMANETS